MPANPLRAEGEEPGRVGGPRGGECGLSADGSPAVVEADLGKPEEVNLDEPEELDQDKPVEES
jgi:hypothetical protein